MEVTAVKVYPIRNKVGNSKAVAIATVTLDASFAINKIEVVDGQNGLFVSMPQRLDKKNNVWRDICNPTTKELRDKITSAVVDEYKKVVSTNTPTQTETKA
jgi:stage V sporulation protein G